MTPQVPNRPTPEGLAKLFELQTGVPLTPPPSKIYTNPTPSAALALPEYSPAGGVAISYPGTVVDTGEVQLPPSGPRNFGIPDELIIRMQQADSSAPVHIFIFCDDASQLDVLLARFAAAAQTLNLTFLPDFVHLVPWDTDTYWTRDYSPWWMQYQQPGRYAIAKHVYTTLGGGSVGLVAGAEHVDPREGLGIFRPNDDSAAVKLSDYLNAPVRAWNEAAWNTKKLPQIAPHDWFFTGLLEVGGNYMVTGKGVLASSYLVATQNALPVPGGGSGGDPSDPVIDQRMEYILGQFNRFMGVNTYHVLSDPTGTYIGHIDCWGKFLADDKVLIADSMDPKVSAALTAIASTFAAQGFQVFRVMCQDMYIPDATPPTATTAAYTNSLILNDHVYVPVAGAPYEQRDAAALAVYQQALPGYTIVGIPPKPDTPWLGTDALHCRTHMVPRAVVDSWVASQQPPLVAG
ncbi:agmatine deiminase family protein [Cellulomonas sp. Leaf334]|uniref:agmatine deiminase family protein n=1 Tax=Cellulomonas sp. Leaf334 TaxID=1736339 RepID=UPI0006F500EA|nr:agmatine deiminase family protein [Cellulomonas sp. Leaf334]KQR08597.1 hypothetical protein ASF78_20380 [Cellulomonas sp. Leaf334]